MEKSSSLGNIRASRIKELIKREGITQAAFAIKLPVTSRKGQDPITMMEPQNLARCLTSGKVSEKLCRKINKVYPEYRIGWLLGYEEHATQKEELSHKEERRLLMERVYISGPITGVENYLKRFRDAERNLIYKGYTSIVNPAEVSRHLPDDFTHEEYMRVCLAELECCNIILMLRGWESSKGARIEKEFAEKKGMRIVYQ